MKKSTRNLLLFGGALALGFGFVRLARAEEPDQPNPPLDPPPEPPLPPVQPDPQTPPQAAKRVPGSGWDQEQFPNPAAVLGALTGLAPKYAGMLAGVTFDEAGITSNRGRAALREFAEDWNIASSLSTAMPAPYEDTRLPTSYPNGATASWLRALDVARNEVIWPSILAEVGL